MHCLLGVCKHFDGLWVQDEGVGLPWVSRSLVHSRCCLLSPAGEINSREPDGPLELTCK